MSLSITVTAGTAEELLSELLAAANAMSAGAGFALTSGQTFINNAKIEEGIIKHADVDVNKKLEEIDTVIRSTDAAAKLAEPTGRTGGRRSAQTNADEGKGTSTARRGRRSASEESLTADTAEQAALREDLIKNLQVLADVEQAHGGVADALKRVGSKNVKEIPSDLLEDFAADIEKLLPLADEKPEAEEVDAETIQQLTNDLKDLADVVESPENDGEDKDVNDTLKAAWKAAGVTLRKDFTNADHLVKLTPETVEDFKEAVAGLTEKYFG